MSGKMIFEFIFDLLKTNKINNDHSKSFSAQVITYLN